MAMRTVPAPRGQVSEALFGELTAAPHRLAPIDVIASADPFGDEDLQLALYCCYELHYRGFEGVADTWEWEPSLLAFRAELERRKRLDLGLLVQQGTPS